MSHLKICSGRPKVKAKVKVMWARHVVPGQPSSFSVNKYLNCTAFAKSNDPHQPVQTDMVQNFLFSVNFLCIKAAYCKPQFGQVLDKMNLCHMVCNIFLGVIRRLSVVYRDLMYQVHV